MLTIKTLEPRHRHAMLVACTRRLNELAEIQCGLIQPCISDKPLADDPKLLREAITTYHEIIKLCREALDTVA